MIDLVILKDSLEIKKKENPKLEMKVTMDTSEIQKNIITTENYMPTNWTN